MKALFLLALFLTSSFASLAAESRPDAKIQTGKLATVRLLATARLTGTEPPDGMRFLFLVRPTAGTTGPFTLKETRDFLIEGESYQTRTLAALGKRFEPGTTVDGAEKFFLKQPAMRRLVDEDIKTGTILMIAIGGAPLTAREKIEVTVNVGYGKEFETFTFNAVVRSPSSAPSKQ